MTSLGWSIKLRKSFNFASRFLSFLNEWWLVEFRKSDQITHFFVRIKQLQDLRRPDGRNSVQTRLRIILTHKFIKKFEIWSPWILVVNGTNLFWSYHHGHYVKSSGRTCSIRQRPSTVGKTKRNFLPLYAHTRGCIR